VVDESGHIEGLATYTLEIENSKTETDNPDTSIATTGDSLLIVMPFLGGALVLGISTLIVFFRRLYLKRL
jgi:hypothetical protein